ncbi:glycosyltransferase [Marinospirillum perlucidum]|uniref:glycosyltransferase n=1 Tax=Marinospirillum perlucidum TaxID=1982602 RepID=UPI00138FFA1A|nr:glycosyltransferase family A protein [Marinospirillum perlucidum]
MKPIKPIVSFLVSTYNSSRTLEALLKSISSQSYQSCEIVVVDNNSNDSTLDIAKKYTDHIFTKGPERSAQRNYAAEMSSGDYLVFLDSDMVLSNNIAQEIVDKFSLDNSLLGLVVPEESFGYGFWSQCKKLERQFYVGVKWMEAARAFRRSVFFDIGGYDEDNTGTEDYDLPHRIEEKYGIDSISRITSFIKHDEGSLDLWRTCKKKLYYARALDVYTAKPVNKEYFTSQSNPLKRYGLFLRSPKLLFRNPIFGFGMLFMKSCEMLFGVLGYLLRKSDDNVKDKIYK